MELLWEDCLCSGLQLARKAIEELGACIYFFLCLFCCCFFFFFQLPWRLGDLNCTSVAGLYEPTAPPTLTRVPYFVKLGLLQNIILFQDFFLSFLQADHPFLGLLLLLSIL